MNIYLEIDNYISLIGNDGDGFVIEAQTVPFFVFVAAIIALRFGYKRYKKNQRIKRQEAVTALLGVGTPSGWQKERSCGCDF